MRVARTVASWLFFAIPCAGVAAEAGHAASTPSQASTAEAPVPALPPRATPAPPSFPEAAELRADVRATKNAVDALQSYNLWLAAIPIVVAVIAAIVGVYTVWRNVGMHKLSLAEKSREEERAAIRTKINEFYAPFIQLRAASKYFYDEAFIPRRAPEEKQKYKGQSGGYRTILALADGYRFTGVDATLLRLIVELGKNTADLIYSKIGLVDDPELQQLLAQATTHFRLMEIAEADGSRVAGLANVIDRFTFPNDLDPKVRDKVTALNARLNELQRTE